MRGVTAWRLVLVLMMGAGWTACASSPPEDKLPSLRDIRPVTSTQRDMPTRDHREILRARITHLELPLGNPLDQAWSLTSQDGLPKAAAALWQANGLKIGALDAAKLSAFLEALPGAVRRETSLLFASQYLAPMAVSSPLTSPRQVLFQETVDGEPQLLAVRRGRFQFLVRITREPTWGVLLDLAPHHYEPKITLEPRSPLETILDGRVFDQLAVRASVLPGQLLIIGRHRPSTTATSDSPTSSTTSTTGSDLTDTAANPFSTPAGDRSDAADLGAVMLTAVRMHQPVQLVVLIQVEEGVMPGR